MKTINKDKAKELINKDKNKIFSAVFIKKDNTKRLINARLGVTKHLKEGARAKPYEASKYELLIVFDMQIKKYRMINFKTLTKLNINKTKYKIK